MRRQLLIGLCLAMIMAFAACHNTSGKKEDGRLIEEQVGDMDPLSPVKDSVNYYLNRARQYVDQDKFGLAMLDVQKAIDLDPRNTDAYLLQADLFYLLGDGANITATLNKALEIDPNDTRVMVKMAELNLLQQNFNLTFGYLDKALTINSYNPKAYFIKGMAYMARQDTTVALKNFLIAREQDPSFFDPQREISAIYIAQHNPLAESFLRSMVTNFPDMPMTRYELAMFVQDNGKPEEALAHYDTLLMLSPNNSRFLYNKGYVYFVCLGDDEKALDYFNQSLQSDPGYIDALYNKGHVLEHMGDYAQAKAIYKQVLEQKSNYQLAIDGLNRIAKRVK